MIPMTKEKYLSFSMGRITFLDSFAFMNSSLGTLVENLNSGKGKFDVFNSEFGVRFRPQTRVRKCLADDEKNQNCTGNIDLKQRHLRVQA